MPPTFTRDIQPMLLWNYHNLSSSVYGTITLYGGSFPEDFDLGWEDCI